MISRRSLLESATLLPAATALGTEGGATWQARRQRYLKQVARAARGPEWDSQRLTTGPPYVLYPEIAKLATGERIEPRAFDTALAYIKARSDCLEFAMSAVLRILYLFGQDQRIPRGWRAQMEQSVLDFRYWLYPEDKPVLIKNCFWTENHNVLFSSAELLAAQLYPDRTFRWTGQPAGWHREHARKQLLVWLAIRARHGFSEWLSPGYYNEDLIGLFNLIDFARDPEIVKAAKAVTELALLDLALHGFDAGMRAASGRAYLDQLKDARHATTGPVISLALGIESPVQPLSSAAVCLATSPSYRPPEALRAIAHSRPEEVLIHERSGISPEEAFAAAFRPEDPSDIFTFWAMQSYTHPRVFTACLEACRRWGATIPTRDWAAKLEELKRAGGDPSKLSDTSNTALYGADIETYRTPDYQLSTAQDYRKGKLGMQQQIWLGSLGGGASVWTSHPGSDNEHWMARPNYWVGNGVLPRAGQHKNLLFVLYRIPQDDPRPFSHVRFPVQEFDEVGERNGWIFGRKGDGYIAVTCRPSMRPATQAEYADVERVCRARESAWICRCGRKARDGSFEQFMARLAQALVEYGGRRLRYWEPGGLTGTFGWDEDLVINGRAVTLSSYPRYDAPFIQAGRGAAVYRIRCGAERHEIDVSGLPVRPFRAVPSARA